MVNIPMISKKPIHTSELGRANQTTGKPQSLRSLTQNRPAQRTPPSVPPPNRVQSAPAAAPAPRPAPRRPHPPATGTALQKGQKISLSQLEPNLDQIEVGLGWDLGAGGQGYELDVEAFLLDSSGKVLGDDWFVFYNQPVSPDGAVRLAESSASGTAPADDAVIRLHLRRINSGVAKITFIVTINDALAHGRNFSNVSNAYVRVVNQAARRELVRFQLTDYYSNVCSMIVGEIYRYKNEWRFNPVGNGTGDDLAGLCTRYGVNI